MKCIYSDGEVGVRGFAASLCKIWSFLIVNIINQLEYGRLILKSDTINNFLQKYSASFNEIHSTLLALNEAHHSQIYNFAISND